MSKKKKQKSKQEEIVTLATCGSSAILCPVALDGKFNLPINKELNKTFINIKKQYRSLIESGLLELGTTFVRRVWTKEATYKDVVFMAIKRDSKDTIQKMYVKRGIEHFMETYRNRVITGITFPIEHFEIEKKDIKKIVKFTKSLVKGSLIEIHYIDGGKYVKLV